MIISTLIVPSDQKGRIVFCHKWQLCRSLTDKFTAVVKRQRCSRQRVTQWSHTEKNRSINFAVDIIGRNLRCQNEKERNRCESETISEYNWHVSLKLNFCARNLIILTSLSNNTCNDNWAEWSAIWPEIIRPFAPFLSVLRMASTFLYWVYAMHVQP